MTDKTATPFFALTFRGLERLAADESAALPGVMVNEVAYRRVLGRAGSLSPLLSLRTVDDVFLHAATWDGLVRQRVALGTLGDAARGLRLHALRSACREVRDVPDRPRFSVTASFVGERNYSTDEIKAVIAAAVRATHRWDYADDDAEADLNVRVFIDGERAHVGVRLAARPLHQREYRVATTPAALKAPVAAAMLRVAGITLSKAGVGAVVDVCGGSGVIALEAALLGVRAVSGDSSGEVLTAASRNVAALPAACRSLASLAHWDGERLPLLSGSVSRIVSDLPWGKQVQVNDSLTALYHRLCAEIERVLSADGCVVLLTSTPALVTFHTLRLKRQVPISLFGQQPTILCYGR